MSAVLLSSSLSSSPSSSRCHKWRMYLGVFPPGVELTVDEEKSCLERLRYRYEELVRQHPYPEGTTILNKDDSEDGDFDEYNDNIEDEEKETAFASVSKCCDPSVDPSSDPPTSPASSSLQQLSFVDPLTAIMMEEASKQEHLQKLNLRYRKERAARRRGVNRRVEIESTNNGDKNNSEENEALQIIDVDLRRLPPWAITDGKRVARLRRILFVYHCSTHPSPGYRQGMHEIASHLLQALEDERAETQTNPLDNRVLAADTFALLSAVLEPLQPAFDVVVQSPSQDKNNDYYGHQPLVEIGKRIFDIVGRYHPSLLHRLQHDVRVPPQLYLTKWIRLLFSRELEMQQIPENSNNHNNNNNSTVESMIIADINNVDKLTEISTQVIPPSSGSSLLFSFWDGLFSLAAAIRVVSNGTKHLLTVLEAAAAARLLLHANRIMAEDDPLNFIMNIPPQTPDSIVDWQITTREILQLSKTLSRISFHSTTTAGQPPAMRSQPQVSSPSLLQQNPHSVSPTHATLPSYHHHDGNIFNNQDPLNAAASANLLLSSQFWKQTLENAKTSFSKRLPNFYLPHQQQQGWGEQQHQQEVFSSYNVDYRENDNQSGTEQMLLYQGSPPAAPSGNINNTAAAISVVHSYLIHLEQTRGITVPPTVWQAMAKLSENSA